MASAQRLYESACPGCGAAVVFRSAASTHAVCGYCSSTVVRNGEALENLGKIAQVFEDYSPLQLFAQGVFNQQSFTVLGRLQYSVATGRWTEWLIAFDDGSLAYLSEDNGSFVMAQTVNAKTALPPASHWVLGAAQSLNGELYTITAVQQASLLAAQGELGKLPATNTSFTLVELRSSAGKVLSIDYSDPAQPSAAMGQTVLLEALKLTGLKDASTSTLQGRQFSCPSCASPISLNLANSKASTCAACNSLIDLSHGIGGQLRYAAQREPIVPQIALGSMGMFMGRSWQVVGYVHRVGVDSADTDDSEQFGWEEYLLYNAKLGFQFLVDSTDGWSLVKPATGAPKTVNIRSVSYMGSVFGEKLSYTSQVDYVAGEFYWPVQRGQFCEHKDFASGNTLLSREQAGDEITWSVGARLTHQTVMKAFGIEQAQAEHFARDADVSAFPWKIVFLVAALIIACVCVIMIIRGSRDASQCDTYYDAQSTVPVEQQREQCKRRYRYSSSSGGSGGSYGGYSSSGGGHK